MRIQEHIFQGFFGIKNKKDSAKYYNERVNKLKGLDNDLDNCIEEFQKILSNYKQKIITYDEFLVKLDESSFKKVKENIVKIEEMFDKEELSKETERKYVLKIEKILKEMTATEENSEISQSEKETMFDLKELLRMIEQIKPLWKKQLQFMEHSYEDIIAKRSEIQTLTDIFKEEANTLRMEELLLKKIDLKTGIILRKTTLKLRDLEKTKDMDMTYRQIRHIR